MSSDISKSDDGFDGTEPVHETPAPASWIWAHLDRMTRRFGLLRSGHAGHELATVNCSEGWEYWRHP